MKSLNEYLALPYKMELIPDPDEGGFVVSFPELPGCLTTGETAEKAMEEWRHRVENGQVDFGDMEMVDSEDAVEEVM